MTGVQACALPIYVEEACAFPREGFTLKKIKDKSMNLCWVIESSHDINIMSSKTDDFSSMEFLQTISINASEPIDLKININNDKITIIEVYRRYLYNHMEIVKADIDKILLESLSLLLQLKEEKMLVPNSIGFNKRIYAWKFIVMSITDTMIPRAYPVLNWAITVFCMCFNIDWETTIKQFEDLLQDKDEYTKYLNELIGKVEDNDIKDLFVHLIQFDNLCKSQRLKDVDLTIINQNSIIKNSASKMATEVGYFYEFVKVIKNTEPYLVLECGHTLTYAQATQMLHYLLWLEWIGPYGLIRCDSCGSFVSPEHVNLNCGCKLYWKENLAKLTNCKCDCSVLRIEDIIFTQGQFPLEMGNDRFFIGYINESAQIDNVPMNIEVLDLQKIPFTNNGDKIAKLLKKLTKLQSVNFSATQLSGKDMNNICGALETCKNLRILDLSQNHEGDWKTKQSFIKLLKSDKLHTLGLRNCGISKEHKELLNSLPFLNRMAVLDLGNLQIIN